MGKNPHRKVVRQIPNSRLQHRIDIPLEKKINFSAIEKKIEEPKVEEIKENKETKENKDMADERLEKIEKIVGAKAPKRTIKREKKEKGLIERTENSAILLTEDNKMLLND